MTEIKSVITVAGYTFNMSGESGYGLIQLAGLWTLISFTSPLESMPPQGGGIIIGQEFSIQVMNGEFSYNGQPVHTEIK